MSTMAFQMTGVLSVNPTVCSGTDHRKHQSSASLAFVRGIHRRPVNSRHKGAVMRKMCPFDDVFMYNPLTNIWYWQILSQLIKVKPRTSRFCTLLAVYHNDFIDKKSHNYCDTLKISEFIPWSMDSESVINSVRMINRMMKSGQISVWRTFLAFKIYLFQNTGWR